MNTWNPHQAYNDLPNLPPSEDVESKEVLKQCIKARAALAELKQAAELILNQSMLINTLPLMEAQASSEIENIVTTSDKLFQYSNFESQADAATKEVLRYRKALLEGFQSIKRRPLNTNTAILICQEIQGKEVNIRKTPGTTLKNSSTGEVIYTPPEGESILRDKLANWEQFIHGDDNELDPLIILAISHYQFEAIHPFIDGNGRTGRVLNSLFLIEKGLLSLPILYLSRYIIQSKQDYYNGLINITANKNWHDWLMYILKGIEETSIWTKNKILAIEDLREVTSQYIKKQLPNIYSYELINALFEQPYIRINNLEEQGIAKRQTASKYLQELVKINVLTVHTQGRDKLFIQAKLLNLLLQDDNVIKPYKD